MERDETRAVTEADLDRALSNVERIGFVGTTERFASSLLGFRRLHGWPLVPVHVRYRQEGRIRAHDLEAEVVEAVRDRQRFDVALQQRLAGEAQQRLRRMSGVAAGETGAAAGGEQDGTHG